MSSLHDLYLSKDPNSMQSLPVDQVNTEPDNGSVWDVIGIGQSIPSIGSAWIKDKLDRIEGAKPLSVTQLQEKYPDAPELFKHPSTARMAEFIYERAYNEKLHERLKEMNQEGSALPHWVRDLGYGISSTSPVTATVGAVIGAGVVAAAPAIGLGTVVGGTLSASALQWGAMGMIDAHLTGTFEYLMTKQQQSYTDVEPNYTNQVLLPTVLGGAFSYFGGAAKNYFSKAGKGAKNAFDTAADDWLKNGKNYINIPDDKITRIPRGSFKNEWHAWNQVEGGGPAPKQITNTMGVALPEPPMPTTENATILGKMKYKTYSGAEYFPVDAEPNMRYALHNAESPMSHHGAEEAFAGATYLSENSGDVRAFASSVNQKGNLLKVDISNSKIADLNKDPALFNMVADIVEQFKGVVDSEVPRDTAQSLMRFIARQDAGDLIQHDISLALKADGYEGIAYSTAEKISDKVFRRNHLFMFDGIKGIPTKTVDILDGTAGALPQEVTLNNEIASKAYNLRYGNGITSNGKEIKLDPYGMFSTDPIFGDEAMRITYTEYFDKSAVDKINKLVEGNNIGPLRKAFPQIQRETIDYLKQLKMYEHDMGLINQKELADELFSNPSAFANLPKKQRLEIISQVETSVKKKKEIDDLILGMANSDAKDVEIKQIEILKTQLKDIVDNNLKRSIVNKSVEQLTREGKAQAIIEQAKVDEMTKTLVDRVFKRVGTDKAHQIDHIITEYNARVEALANQDPSLYDEIIKAVDFCLRRNS